VRTTIDLPDDLHDLARHLSHEGNRSMSEVIAELIRMGLRHEASAVDSGSRGLPVVTIGRPITAQDVRSLDDDE
jgi:metal-responsive CopG/Arc/MetJ family transcriptional regulator